MKTFVCISAMLIFMTGAKFSYAEGDDLIGQLTKELDIIEDQAKGGAGALFNYSKESLSEDEFEQVENSVPDMGGYLDAIPSSGGKKKGMLNKATSALTGMPAVTSAFDKLGLSPEMVGMFTPILTNYVEKKGGKAVGDLLMKALK